MTHTRFAPPRPRRPQGRQARFGVLLLTVGALLAPSAAALAATTISGSASVRILAPLVGGDLTAQEAWALALSPDGSTLYATETSDADVLAIDVATNTSTAVPLGPGSAPYSVAVAPDGSAVFVGNSGTDVQRLTPAPFVVDNSTFGGSEPRGVAVSPDSTTLYVAAHSGGALSMFDAATLTFLGDFSFVAPIGVAVSPDGSHLAVTDEGDNTATLFSLAAFPPSGRLAVPVDPGPRFLAFSPDSSTLWVAAYAGSTVTPIDTATGVAGSAIPVGVGPAGLSVSPDGRWLYVMVDTGSAYVVVDTVTRTVVSSMPSSLAFPYSLAMRSDGSRLYTGSGGAADIVVVDPADLELAFTAPDRIDPGTALVSVPTTMLDGLPTNGDYSGGTLLVELLDSTSSVVATSSGLDTPDPVTGAAQIDLVTASLPVGTYSMRVTWSNGGTTIVASAAGFRIGAVLPPTGADPTPSLILAFALIGFGTILVLSRSRRVA